MLKKHILRGLLFGFFTSFVLQFGLILAVMNSPRHSGSSHQPSRFMLAADRFEDCVGITHKVANMVAPGHPNALQVLVLLFVPTFVYGLFFSVLFVSCLVVREHASRGFTGQV